MKLVSVVIPIYNVEKYLSDCMKSIFAQDYRKLEIILVDDGSSDKCGELCDQYMRFDSRIIVIHQKNAGLSAARNAGIKIAKGDFITFVDSDDMLAPGFVKMALELAEDNQADIVVASNVRCESDARWSAQYQSLAEMKVIVYSDSIQKMKKFLIGTDIGTIACAKLYRRELFDTIRYPVGKYHEDVFTTYKVVDKANRIVTTSRVGYIYRKNPNSITMSGFSVKHLDIVEGKREQLAFIQKFYPNLQKEAEMGVIYACNQCMMLMAKVDYNKQITDEFQKLYREYGKSYLISSVSIKGKTLTCVAMLNVKLACFLLQMVL